MNKIERIGEVMQSLNDLKGLINLNSFLARDLGLNLLSVLFTHVSKPRRTRITKLLSGSLSIVRGKKNRYQIQRTIFQKIKVQLGF